jgi:hypothetical protein
MGTQQPGTFWDAVRSWADSVGLLLPAESAEGGPQRPVVPPEVCDNCPICQGAATLEQVNPQVLVELADVARSLLSGVGSALAAAADQRAGVTHVGDVAGTEEPLSSDGDEPAAEQP